MDTAEKIEVYNQIADVNPNCEFQAENVLALIQALEKGDYVLKGEFGYGEYAHYLDFDQTVLQVANMPRGHLVEVYPATSNAIRRWLGFKSEHFEFCAIPKTFGMNGWIPTVSQKRALQWVIEHLKLLCKHHGNVAQAEREYNGY